MFLFLSGDIIDSGIFHFKSYVLVNIFCFTACQEVVFVFKIKNEKNMFYEVFFSILKKRLKYQIAILGIFFSLFINVMSSYVRSNVFFSHFDI